MNRTTVLLSLLVLGLLLLVASCGGGSGVAQLGDAPRDAQGISEQGFNLVRYDDSGNLTDTLNPTLDLDVRQDGALTTVKIAIDDQQPMQGVTLDLHYDANQFSPQDVQFGELIDTPLEMAVTSVGGLVALGQVGIGAEGVAERSGQFAVVTFRNSPSRFVSAAGDAADRPINSTYSANGFTAEGFTAAENAADDHSVDYNILGIFTSLSGDGDQNGSTNIADLTPLGAMLNRPVSDTDANSARVDYDGNGLPTIADLTPIGASFNEVTTGIEILLGEDQDSLAVVATLDWAAGDNPELPSNPTGDANDVWRNWSGTLDAATVDAQDTNTDGTVCISARAVTNDPGVDGTAFPCIPLDLGAGSSSLFTIESVSVDVAGWPVGTGGNTASVIANGFFSVEVLAFDGKFNGADFDPQLLSDSTTPTQAEYDAEKALIQADIEYTSTVDVESNYPDIWQGAIIEGDNNPDSLLAIPDDEDGNTAEGTLTLIYSNANNLVPDTSITIDLTEDFDAPLVDDVKTGSQDLNGNWVVTNVDPLVTGHLSFPTGDPVPIDATTVTAELVNLTDDSVVRDLDYVVGPPMLAGTFSLVPGVTGWDYTARMGSGDLQFGDLYMLRFYNTTTGQDPNGSSVNKAGAYLTGGEVDTNFATVVLPGSDIQSDENMIAFIAADPVVRRAPQQLADLGNGGVMNVYGNGYFDELKSSGQEFTLGVDNGVLYPMVVAQPGDLPSEIAATATTNPETIPTEVNPHRLLLDVAGHIRPGTPEKWVYRIFGQPATSSDLASRPIISEGTFTLQPEPPLGGAPLVGVNFGINIWDGAGEGDLTLGSEDWSDKNYSLANIDSPSFGQSPDPEVLFVQFNGGSVVPQPFNINPFEGFSSLGSNLLILHDPDAVLPDMQKTIDVRVAGLGVGGIDYIGIVHLVATDLFPSGNLLAGESYDVQLNDPGNGPAVDYTFPTDQLTVSN